MPRTATTTDRDAAMETAMVSASAQAATVHAEAIPFDQCICGPTRKHPRSNCWASMHDCEPKP